jgi:hypothetical protein
MAVGSVGSSRVDAAVMMARPAGRQVVRLSHRRRVIGTIGSVIVVLDLTRAGGAGFGNRGVHPCSAHVPVEVALTKRELPIDWDGAAAAKLVSAPHTTSVAAT